MNPSTAIPERTHRRGRVRLSLVGLAASLMLLAVLSLTVVRLASGSTPTPAQASIAVAAPEQITVSVAPPEQRSGSTGVTEPGYVSPFSNSATGSPSYSLAGIELNLDPNCECLGFF